MAHARPEAAADDDELLRADDETLARRALPHVPKSDADRELCLRGITSCPLFEDLSPWMPEALVGAMTEIVALPGADVVTQGSVDDDSFFVLAEGGARVLTREYAKGSEAAEAMGFEAIKRRMENGEGRISPRGDRRRRRCTRPATRPRAPFRARARALSLSRRRVATRRGIRPATGVRSRVSSVPSGW